MKASRSCTTLKKSIKFMCYLLFGSKPQKARAKQELAYRVANLFGDYPFSEAQQIWRQDKSFLENYKRLSPFNNFSQDRKFTLREFVKATSDIEGAIVECGTYEGASAYFIAEASPNTEVYLVDSFEGISEPEEYDRVDHDEVRQWRRGDLRSCIGTAQQNLKDYSNIRYYKGWIPDILKDVPDSPLKLIHLDLDLYMPTKQALDHFYPKLVNNGIIILDDYGFLTCPGVKLAADEFATKHSLHIILLTSGQGVIFKK